MGASLRKRSKPIARTTGRLVKQTSTGEIVQDRPVRRVGAEVVDLAELLSRAIKAPAGAPEVSRGPRAGVISTAELRAHLSEALGRAHSGTYIVLGWTNKPGPDPVIRLTYATGEPVEGPAL